MNENEKDFTQQLTDLDDYSVEEIAEEYPALDENTKKRILKLSLAKSGFPDEDEETESDEYGDDEIEVSGTEIYENKISWHKYAGSAVAMLVAVVGITSVILLHRNMNDDDFDISDPPFSQEYNGGQQTEIVPGSYIDNGYNANGFDYANVNGYEGSVQYGVTTAPPVPDDYVANLEDTPVYNDNTADTPAAPAPTAPAPVAPATEAPTVPPTTETTEAVKSYLNAMYYVTVADKEGCMGYEMRPEGTMTVSDFDETGNITNVSGIIEYYFTDEEFSFGTAENLKTGKLLTPKDAPDFSVQFEDGVYNFSINAPVFAEPEISVNGTWKTSGYTVERQFTFNDSTMTGTCKSADSDEEITFTYERNVNELTLHFDNGEIMKATLTKNTSPVGFVAEWSDGNKENFEDVTP